MGRNKVHLVMLISLAFSLLAFDSGVAVGAMSIGPEWEFKDKEINVDS